MEERNKFLENKRTDEIDGYKYIVILPDFRYEKLIVTINGSKIRGNAKRISVVKQKTQ